MQFPYSAVGFDFGSVQVGFPMTYRCLMSYQAAFLTCQEVPEVVLVVQVVDVTAADDLLADSDSMAYRAAAHSTASSSSVQLLVAVPRVEHSAY